MGSGKRSVKAGPTLLDFLENRGGAESRKNEVQHKSEKPPAKKEGELLQSLIELFESRLRCFKRDEVALALNINTVLAVRLLNELVQVGVVKKRLNDDGELVYCPARGL